MSKPPTGAAKREWYAYLTLVVAMFWAMCYFALNEGDVALATIACFAMLICFMYWKDLEV